MSDTDTPPQSTNVETKAQPGHGRKRLYVIIAVVAVVFFGGGIGVYVATSAAATAAEERANDIAARTALREKGLAAFEKSLDLCSVSDVDDWSSVTDGGQTMELNGAGEYVFSGLPFQKVECVLRMLDAPTRVATLMGQTRALDGRQSDEWETSYGTIDVSWTYHPDDGLDALLALELKDKLQDIPAK